MVSNESKKSEPAESRAQRSDFALLRASSAEFKTLMRNVRISFESRGFEVQLGAVTEEEPREIKRIVPCMTAIGPGESYIVEFATARMLENAYLAKRLLALARAKGHKRWLVVPSDSVSEAQDLVKWIACDWSVVPSD